MRNLRLVFVLVPLFGACAADNSLQAVLARVDSAAAKYKGMKASITKIAYLGAIKQSETDTGTVVARRSNPKDLRMLIALGPPNPKKVLLGPNKAEIYYPGMNSVDEYDLGKVSGMKDKLLLLSFGGTSKELQSAYTVTVGPSETVGGKSATRLDLVPKDKQLLSTYPRVQLWIAEDTGIAVQQKLIGPTGDYDQATYTNIQLTNITDGDLKLDVPKDAKREKPLKR